MLRRGDSGRERESPQVRHLRSDRRRRRLHPVISRRDAKVKLISQVPLFQGCSQPELARIAGIMTQLDEPEGKVLIRQGEPGGDFFVLAEGTAEVRKGNRRVSTLGPGDFAGEIALLTNAPRTATVRTTSQVSVLRVKSVMSRTRRSTCRLLQRLETDHPPRRAVRTCAR